ncbi:MAG: TonB-dependent receptor [Chitinophagaceae bacterium]|nr:TonB-dependent receptor [Chitinophagaceae bacterium]
MKCICSAILILLVGLQASAQIKGSVHDSQGNPLEGVTISLLRAKDSSIEKLAVSKQGNFIFPIVKQGHYLVRASHVGYTTITGTAIKYTDAAIAIPDIILDKSRNNLQEVTVTGKKPVIEVKADKMIMNVEGTINATGSDALELLRKSPNVTVDKDDNLSIAGKNGVHVYIDGRPSPLAGQDLANYLKSLQSSQIEAIEIITNPSAKYDAAGNAGIINIRLKKNNSFGTNGSLSAGWNQGIYPKINGAFSLNHRDKLVNLYGSVSFNEMKQEAQISNYRTVLDSIFDQHGLLIANLSNRAYKGGIDYFASKKSTWGLMINGSHSAPTFLSPGTTSIVYAPSGITSRVLVADNTNKMSRDNANINANYTYVNGTKENLSINADYGYFNLYSDQLQPNIYYDASRQHELSRVVYNMLSPSKIDLLSIKADYEKDYKQGKLGLGFKTSYAKTDNDFQRYDVYTSGKVLDTVRSNRFLYDEMINAMYINYNRAYKGFVIQWGLRLENTLSKGTSKDSKAKPPTPGPQFSTDFLNDYVGLFPSAAITFNKNPAKQLSFTFSRRIDRPNYQDLNPFEFKLDAYTFQKGNTELRPQYTNSVGMTYLYHSKLNITLNYSHVKDMFSQLIDTTERSKVFVSKQNLATQNILSLNTSYPIQYKSFSSFVNINANYSRYSANYGPGREIDLDAFAGRVFVQNSLRFSKTWTAELSGFYSTPGINQGTFKTKAMGGIDIGLQKQVFHTNGTVRVAVSDVLKTLKYNAYSNFSGQYVRTNVNFDSRLLKLSFSYRFGSAQIKSARQRKTGLEDETNRVQAGSNTGPTQ